MLTPMEYQEFKDARRLSKTEDLSFGDKLYLALKIKTCNSCKDLIDCLKGKYILDCGLEKINKKNHKNKDITDSKNI